MLYKSQYFNSKNHFKFFFQVSSDSAYNSPDPKVQLYFQGFQLLRNLFRPLLNFWIYDSFWEQLNIRGRGRFFFLWLIPAGVSTPAGQYLRCPNPAWLNNYSNVTLPNLTYSNKQTNNSPLYFQLAATPLEASRGT